MRELKNKIDKEVTNDPLDDVVKKYEKGNEGGSLKKIFDKNERPMNKKVYDNQVEEKRENLSPYLMGIKGITPFKIQEKR